LDLTPNAAYRALSRNPAKGRNGISRTHEGPCPTAAGCAAFPAVSGAMAATVETIELSSEEVIIR
jgi:hypothetical protein